MSGTTPCCAGPGRVPRTRIPAVLPALLFVLAFAGRVSAADCNSPPTGSYGPSWAREYQSWCVSCCGTFSMSGGNPSCSPGSNWGCKGQGLSGAGAGAYPGAYNGFYQMGYQIGQGIGRALFGDPQEEARIRAQALQRNRQMLESLDERTKEQMRQEDAMLLDASERSRLLADRQRQEALSSLKGIPQGDGELTLKPGTDFFGVPGNPKGGPFPPSDPSVVDLRRLDPGKPVMVDDIVLREIRHETVREKEKLPAAECEKRKIARDRLAGGLPVQQEAIRRTESQLEAAKKGVGEASAEKRQVLLQGAIQEAKEYAKDILTSAKALRAQVELLKELDANRAERDLLIRSIDTVLFEGESLADAAQAGYKGGEELGARVDKLSGRILSLADRLLMQSGIAEKAGEELAEKLGGPLGALGFRGARLSIDFTVALGKGMISETEREAAQKNLDIMRGQHQRAKRQIADLERDLAEGCKDTIRAHP